MGRRATDSLPAPHRPDQPRKPWTVQNGMTYPKSVRTAVQAHTGPVTHGSRPGVGGVPVGWEIRRGEEMSQPQSTPQRPTYTPNCSSESNAISRCDTHSATNPPPSNGMPCLAGVRGVH